MVTLPVPNFILQLHKKRSHHPEKENPLENIPRNISERVLIPVVQKFFNKSTEQSRGEKNH
jgi:hypothetical protein